MIETVNELSSRDESGTLSEKMNLDKKKVFLRKTRPHYSSLIRFEIKTCVSSL